MSRLQEETGSSIVDAAHKMMGDVSGLVSRMQQVAEQFEQLREQYAKLDRTHQDLREREQRLREEGDEAAESLAEARAAYKALLAEYEAKTEILQRVGGDREGLLREREDTARDIRRTLELLRK